MPNFMPIPGESDDARAVRTRADLANALISLMFERAFDEISVQDICERALVGRSTFYAHFQDKDELYIRHVVVTARTMGEQLAWDAARGAYHFPIAGLFEHVRQMKPMIDSLARARKYEFMMKVWQNNLAEVFEQRVRAQRCTQQNGSPVAIPAEILAQQLAGTLITLMTWWMDHHQPCTATEMEQQYQRLVAGLN